MAINAVPRPRRSAAGDSSSGGQRSAVRAIHHAPWTSGLRGRITALAVLVALLSTGLCAIVGAKALRKSYEAQDHVYLHHQMRSLSTQIDQITTDLVREVEDQVRESGLYAAMPSAAPPWTAADRQRGSPAGRVAQVFALIADGTLHSRHVFGRQGDPASDFSSVDPAEAGALVSLAHRAPVTGLAWLRGAPAWVVARRILRPDGSGPSVGVLLGIRYLDQPTLERIPLVAGTLRVGASSEKSVRDGNISSEEGGYAATLARRCVDGGALDFTVTRPASTPGQVLLQAQRDVVVAGLLGVILAAALGILLGLRWVRPLFDLADCCRRRVEDPTLPLPSGGDLEEAVVLAAALDDLGHAERRQREILGQALDREAATSALQQRFLAQLGHELGDPVRALHQALDQLGSSQTSEEDARRQLALLEERLFEIQALTVGMREGPTPGRHQDIGLFVYGIVELLRPVAIKRGVELVIDSQPFTTALDARLLSPIIVNLLANALRFAHLRVLIATTAEENTLTWDIIDDGPGFSEATATVIAEAFIRGNVLPGSKEIGLGLAVAIANARSLGGHLALVACVTGAHVRLTIPQTGGDVGSGRRSAVEITALRLRRQMD